MDSTQAPPLAVIGQILSLAPIKDADRIVLARVACGAAGTWSGIVPINAHALGEAVTVFLQDAMLPADSTPTSRWAFMEARKWRIRMVRFKGVPSECLIVKSAPDERGPPGTDVGAALGVTKYFKPIPASMAGEALGEFPSFIPKTDEPNFQTVPEMVAQLANEPWCATEKADGTSCTVWNDAAGLHVCSRNWELREFSASGAGNAYWQVARKYGLERLEIGLALQFEVVGPGIQGNPMGLPTLEARVFNLYDHQSRQHRGMAALRATCEALGIPPARIVVMGEGARSDDALRELAQIKYASGKQGEGIVIRPAQGEVCAWSFKVISLLYKD